MHPSLSTISINQMNDIKLWSHTKNLNNLVFLNKSKVEIKQLLNCVNCLSDSIVLNNFCNLILWKSEDKIRASASSPIIKVNLKKIIDFANQNRNEAIGLIDTYFIHKFKFSNKIKRVETETPGMIIDRLSIINLKLYHLDFYSTCIGQSFDIEYRERKKILNLQKKDLISKHKLSMNLYKNKLCIFRVYSPQKFYNEKRFFESK
jgi:hypothetical protein